MQDPVRGGWKAEYLSEHNNLQFDQSMDVVLALARFDFIANNLSHTSFILRHTQI